MQYLYQEKLQKYQGIEGKVHNIINECKITFRVAFIYPVCQYLNTYLPNVNCLVNLKMTTSEGPFSQIFLKFKYTEHSFK